MKANLSQKEANMILDKIMNIVEQEYDLKSSKELPKKIQNLINMHRNFVARQLKEKEVENILNHAALVTSKDIWILSCGTIFEGLSRDKKRTKKHIRLCFIGTKTQVLNEWKRLQHMNKVLGRGEKSKSMVIYQANVGKKV